MNRITGILVVGVVAAIGCNAESPRTNGEGDLLAAGIPGAASTALSDQDSTPMVVRRVWGGPDVDLGGSVSPDGRYLTFIDWSTGNVAAREIATGEVRLLTDDGSWEPYESAMGSLTISPDGKRVVYHWYRQGQPIYYELRIVGMDGTGHQVLYANESVEYFGAAAWSPDGEQIVTVQSIDDGPNEMLLISVADGLTRTLKQFESGWPWAFSFSPDGRFIAYDFQTENNSEIRDIIVLSLDDGREMPLVQHPADDFLLGWAPDGKHVLFASDRTGTVGAWIQPVADGQAAGDPKLVKPDLWRVWPLGFTRDGAFFYGVNMTARDVYIASVDPRTGAVLAPPASVNPTHLAWDYRPAWSPDGRYLAYLSGFGARIYTAFTRMAYSIRSVETGETRKLLPDLNSFGRCLWWVDGHSLLVPGRDRNDRTGLFKVDVQTGEAEPLPAFWDVDIARLIDPSPDGKRIFFSRRVNGKSRIIVMDLETGRETALYDEGWEIGPSLSPDGRHLAFVVKAKDTHRLLVMPAAGGEPREVHQYGNEGGTTGNVAWSRDGRSLFFPVEADDGQHQLWRAFVAGGPPQKLDITMETLRGLRVHPDGRRIAFDSGSGGAEVWVMEDFLPERPTESP
jgi:Tol biopolymer transport system component